MFLYLTFYLIFLLFFIFFSWSGLAHLWRFGFPKTTSRLIVFAFFISSLLIVFMTLILLVVL